MKRLISLSFAKVVLYIKQFSRLIYLFIYETYVFSYNVNTIYIKYGINVVLGTLMKETFDLQMY